MRRVSLGPAPSASFGHNDPTIRWITAAIREIEQASHQDLVTLVEGYGYTGTLTETRTIDLAAPSAANVAAVLATFILDVKRQGSKRRREET